MFVIGQEINIFNSEVFKALLTRDEKTIAHKVRKILDSDADAIELNLGGWQSSNELLPWLVDVVKKETSCPIFLSPIPANLKEALDGYRASAFINCVTADESRLESMLSGAKCLGVGLVVLLTKKGFLPKSLDEICLLAEDVLERAEAKGFPMDKLLLDPVFRPRFSPDSSGYIVNRPDVTFFAEAIYLIGRLRQKKVKTIAALSNLTIGLKAKFRESFELSALEILKLAGLDYIILNTQNKALIKKAKEKSRVYYFDSFGLQVKEQEARI